MAKQNYLKLALVIVLTMAASSTVYAAAVSVGTSIGGSSFAASNKVSCYYEGVATFTSYTIACGHNAGDKVIAAKSGDAKLYFATAAANAATAGAAAISSTSDFTVTSTWTSM
ncbi:MAG: hypothetical protein WCI45_13305 [Desulfuromonadales bacterium]